MNDVTDMTKYINTLRDIFTEVPRIFEQNDRRIEELDKESGDIIHAMELLEFDEVAAARYATELRENRLQRRRCKDENALLKPLYDFIKMRSKFINELERVQEETEKESRFLVGRTYHPRVRLELTEAFEQATRTKQEAILREQGIESDGNPTEATDPDGQRIDQSSDGVA